MKKVYIDLPIEIQRTLAENLVDLSETLQAEGLGHQIEYEVPAYQHIDGVRTRDLTPFIMIAGGGLALSVGIAISKILNTIWDRPHLVEICEEEAWRDRDGNIMLDKDGKPMTKIEKRYELIEPRAENRDISLNLSAGKNVVVRVRSTETHPK